VRDRPASPWRSPIARAPQRPASTPARARRLQAGIPTWFYALGGAATLLALATVLIVVKNSWLDTGPKVDAGGNRDALRNADAGLPIGPVTTAPTSEPPPGDQTSERLRKVIEAQAQLANACQGESCLSPWTKFARETMVHSGPGIVIEPSSAPEPLPPWLRKLRKPDDFPLVDDPLLKGTFDYDAKHVKGHPLFQNTINRCCVYSDIIDGALVKYGVPGWLAAVVYQESQCDPKARSPVGALGLWQFMPESARAYDLQVVEDEVDERMNPVKATDAAVRFVADLQRKLGAWDLALAAYNAGPYGVAARIAQVGGHASFWDLVRSDLLPDETARYVPAIEAQALILQNLAALDFLVQCQVEDAAEVRANPGTRLSLVARAANTSTRRIRELNLDFLKDVVPNQENAVRVPTTEAPHAQQFLDQVDPHDTRDTCVPDAFDWGHTNFEDSPYAKGCAHSAAQ
jgi:peptidoglycan lytic transglycosylase D